MLEKIIYSYTPIYIFMAFGFTALFFGVKYAKTDKKVYGNLMALFCAITAATLIGLIIISYSLNATRTAEHEKFMKEAAKREAAAYAEHARRLIVGPDLPPHKVPEMPARPTSPPEGMTKPGWNLAMGDLFPPIGIARTTEEFTMWVEHPTRGKLKFRGDETFSRIADPEVAIQYPDLMTTYINGEVTNSSGVIVGRFNLTNHSWQSGYGADLRGSCIFEGEAGSIRLRVVLVQ